MENQRYKVIGVNVYEGVSRSGLKDALYTYDIDIDGKKAKIKSFENNAQIGDFVEIGVGLRKNLYGNELTAVITGVHPAPEK